MKPVYLDHAATTPLDPKVLDAMAPYFTDAFGNPSSVHQLGRKARHAVEECRNRVADVLGAAPGDIVFTSGGTEADNLALQIALQSDNTALITSAAEHDAILQPAKRTSEKGHPVTVLPVDETGAVNLDALRNALEKTRGEALVSIMYVNNELGTLNPLGEIASMCREFGATFHTDAVQAAGLFQLDVDELDVDLLSLSAHKIYGPKGVGLLYVRGGVDLPPLHVGGGQERDRRAGTENVPSIVGLTEALERAASSRQREWKRLQPLRQYFLDRLETELDVAYVVNGAVGSEHQAPHVINVAFPSSEVDVDGEMLLLNMDMEGICVSSGSACASGAVSPSHVLRAIGLDKKTANAAIRFSLGKSTTEREIDDAAAALGRVVQRMVPVAT